MKNVFLSLTLIFGGLHAGASTINPYLLDENSNLTRISVDQNLPQDVSAAQVRLNTRSQKIVLTLTHLVPCTAKGDLICQSIRLEQEVIALPILKMEANNCGAMVYTATRDARPVDGNFQQIVLTDNRTMTCRMMIPADRFTIVDYTLIEGGRAGGQSYHSEFTGAALRNLFAMTQNMVKLQTVAPKYFMKTADLTTFDVAQGQVNGTVDKAQIEIHPFAKKIVLKLEFKPLCPVVPGHVSCKAVGPKEQVIELPLILKTTNRCGVVIYTASLDLRPTDGDRNEIVVADNMANVCARLPENAMTAVTFSTDASSIAGPRGSYTSQFSGGPLQNM